MSIISFIVALMSALAIGLSFLSALLLAPRANLQSIYLPLALFFLANLATEVAGLLAYPIIFELIPFYSSLTGFYSIPLHCVLAPLFWIYVRGLTSEHSVIWSASDVRHFALALTSLILPIAVSVIPSHELLALFKPSSVDAPRSAIQTMIIVGVKAVDALIILQVAFYIVLIVRRLAVYRSKLSQLFASTEHLELRWFRWLALFMFTYIALSIISLLAEALFRSPHSMIFWEKLLDVALITTLAVWGLRQKPGLAIESQALNFDNKQTKKYQHSALSPQQCKRLSEKIQQAMSEQKLYQRDDLSLRILAKHIGELPSYVTQTLNTEIGESFFDYVNGWRIDQAAKRLRDSDATVLHIATDVGFNSRSSFYNAFKKIHGVTPTAYRKRLT